MFKRIVSGVMPVCFLMAMLTSCQSPTSSLNTSEISCADRTNQATCKFTRTESSCNGGDAYCSAAGKCILPGPEWADCVYDNYPNGQANGCESDVKCDPKIAECTLAESFNVKCGK
jgi:hypothetical protein